MNPDSEIELKKIVEGVVRPLQAGFDRKKQLRAELLAHIQATYDEERVLTEDEVVALQRTRERFGDTAQLTKEMQATLSKRDRVLFAFDRLLQPRSGESELRCSFRRAGYFFLAMEILIPPATAWTYLLHSQRLTGGRWLYFVFLLSTALSFAMFAGSLVTMGLRRLLFRTTGRRIASLAVLTLAAAILVPLCELFLYFGVSGDWQDSVWNTRIALPFAVLVPMGLPLLAWACEREQRYRDEWGQLELE